MKIKHFLSIEIKSTMVAINKYLSAAVTECCLASLLAKEDLFIYVFLGDIFAPFCHGRSN